VPLRYEGATEFNRKKAVEAIEDARSRVEKGVTKRLNITAETPEGSPKQVIVEEAEKWGADLIVVGSHGYGWWERILLGSVSQAVIHHAPCSVEVVRAPK
jgi:nucleotide-binding universal stress UspA family protein